MLMARNTKPAMHTPSLAVWIEAARPRTLPLALISIVVGSALAFRLGKLSPAVTILTLLAASLLQILSNMANDYGDAVKGSDTKERIGPRRVVQAGLVSPACMRKALVLLGFVTALALAALFAVACDTLADVLVFIVLGGLAVLAAITYTVGKKAYGYLGLGDLAVLIFFGWGGVGASAYLQTKSVDFPLFLVSTGLGLLIVAVLNINNLRDLENDRRGGKKTLAVRLGPVWARRYHACLLAGAPLCLALYALPDWKIWPLWLFLLTLPLLYRQARFVLSHPQDADLRPMLEPTVKAALFTGLLLALGLALSRLFL